MREAVVLRQVMKREADTADTDVPGTTTAVVTSFDPVTQSAKVKLQPWDIETGYLPVKTPWAGNGWGLFSPPAVGSYVDVHFEGGDLGAGHIVSRAHNDQHKPLPVPSGELWAVHSSGLRLVLSNDGKALLGGTKTGEGIIMLGNTGDLHKLVKDTFQKLFNEHQHTNVQSGGGISGPPKQQLTDDHMTKETKAS